MTVLVDTPHVVNDNTSFTGTATSTSVTVASGDVVLLVFVGNFYNSGTAVPPNTFTYGGVALTLLSSIGATGILPESSVWYLLNPTAGTATLAGTWTTNVSGGIANVTAVPVSGAATTGTFGTVATASSTANNNSAVTATGSAGGGDLYFGHAVNGIQASTSTGTGQTDISNSTINAAASVVVSTIPGSNAGAFTWTGSGTLFGTDWAALGFVVHAAAPAPTQYFLESNEYF
jgi:hypothetical protein